MHDGCWVVQRLAVYVWHLIPDTRHPFRGVECESTDEYRETAEEGLLGIVEQVVAPPNRIAHGLLPQGQVTRAAAEQWQSQFQAFQQCGRGQDFDPGGRKLDRERESIDPIDDVGNRRQRLGGEAEIGPDGPCPLDKEPDRAGYAGVFDRGRGAQRQRSDRELAFSGEPESDTAGDQELHLWAGVQELAHPWPRGDYLLEVIQDQEQAPSGEYIDQAVEQRHGAHVA